MHQNAPSASSLSEPALITAGELARMLHISTRTLWRMKSAGQLPPPLRLGGAVRWRVEEIRKWIADGCPLRTSPDNGSTKE